MSIGWRAARKASQNCTTERANSAIEVVSATALGSSFYRVEALPLVLTRFLRPRISRGEDLEGPRDIDRSWPRSGKSETRNSPRSGCKRTLSVSANNLCPRSVRPRGRVHKQATSANTSRFHQSGNKHQQRTCTVREHSTVPDWPRPQTRHGPEFSANRDWQQDVRAGVFSFPFGRH